MIIVCPSCSNVDLDALEREFGSDNVEATCLGECGMNAEQSFGYVFEKWVIHDDEDAFMEDVKKRMTKNG